MHATMSSVDGAARRERSRVCFELLVGVHAGGGTAVHEHVCAFHLVGRVHKGRLVSKRKNHHIEANGTSYS